MFREHPCFYSPGRVRAILEVYTDLECAVKYSCALDASDVEPDRDVRGPIEPKGLDGGRRASLLIIKADIDMAMKSLPEELRTAVEMAYKQQLTYREVARVLRCGKSLVGKNIGLAVDRMARKLGYVDRGA